ncbi:helix-turn-helix domain-containing protein [Isoptericola sp. AK164]|uniref:helix-turn-helix domain-containing protein n=1 Tax=Isoptericola sp. AK164 TaxID=3024246 RepID=UPI0024181FA2|nr:helix-turn-helix domain-containing protein [Isoptericola sp. AK164]
MTDPSAATSSSTRKPAPVGAARLRGLSHPLRVTILDLLQVHGSLTASRLAELVGESSGSTSYHLRQLAKHDFVREVEGKGTARERWWEATPGGFVLAPSENDVDDAGTRTALSLASAEFERARQAKIWRLLDALRDGPQESRYADWSDSVRLGTANTVATPQQLHDLIETVQSVIDTELHKLKAQEPGPDARPVQIHFNAFPVVDPEPAPTVQDDAGTGGGPVT